MTGPRRARHVLQPDPARSPGGARRAGPRGVVVESGSPHNLGAQERGHAVEFALFARNAGSVSLLLFDAPESGIAFLEVVLDPRHNRTGDIWHCRIVGVGAGTFYLYRVTPPPSPHPANRSSEAFLVLDPYAHALTGGFRWDLSLSTPDRVAKEAPPAERFPKCVVVDQRFHWRNDAPLERPLTEMVIYEAHVKGLSFHQSADVQFPGTYRGVIEQIPYLIELGITALELLPIQEFDSFEFGRINPQTGQELSNYWGYSTLGFFAPKASYAADGRNGEQVGEFKEMVRELHAAGIEVILDVVYNHTGEGNHRGPAVSFRAIDNEIYYLVSEDGGHYKDFTGTGNTTNANHPVVKRLILDSLRYWVTEMHVDGFRFDLASAMGRRSNGEPWPDKPLITEIAEDPVLRRTKLIAEAWDTGGLYEVGRFHGPRWCEWNDKYRDTCRRFWRGDPNSMAEFATRITGSSDLYRNGGRKPFHSINFLTAHDGFTLNDLVSFTRKHNYANGEQNRDGHNHNYSANYGIEGNTRDPVIDPVRNRQVKNFLTTLLLSAGTPMLLAGDEFRRTQSGNNNAYCQDNALSWMNFELLRSHADIFRFTRLLIRLRRSHPVFHRAEFFTGDDQNGDQMPDITWFGPDGELRWRDSPNALGLMIDGSEAEPAHGGDADFVLLFNASRNSQRFFIPAAREGAAWGNLINTALASPADFRESPEALEDSSELTVPDRSCRVLCSVPALTKATARP